MQYLLFDFVGIVIIDFVNYVNHKKINTFDIFDEITLYSNANNKTRRLL